MSCASGDDGDVHECSSTSSSGDCAVVMNLLPGIIGHADFLELHLCFLRVSLTTPRPEYPLPESAEDLSTLDSKTMFLVFVSTPIHNGKGSKRSESGEEMGLCSPGESGFGLRGRRREAEAAHLGLFFRRLLKFCMFPPSLKFLCLRIRQMVLLRCVRWSAVCPQSCGVHSGSCNGEMGDKCGHLLSVHSPSTNADLS